MDSIDRMEQRINELLQLQSKEKESLHSAMLAKEEDLKQIQADRAAAMARFDASVEVNEAKKYEAVSTEKEILEKALFNADHKPLVSDEEYAESIQAVYTELNELNENAKNELQQLFTRLYEIADNLKERTNKANELLRVWQTQIRRNPDDMFNGLGGLQVNPAKKERYRYWHFVSFMESIRETYEALMAHKVTERG